MRAIDQGLAPTAYEAIAKVLEEKGIDAGKIGIEEKCCTASTYQNLMKVLPKAKIVGAGDILYQTRSVKEPEEIVLIKKAIEIAESAVQVARDMAKPGVIEMDVQLAMEIEMKRLGAFREVETMCQSGIRTAHYRAFAADWKKIEKDEPVTIDLGGLYKGYGCDIARTWIAGTPTAEQKKIARDLYATYEKFCNVCKPGKTFAEVFDYIRGRDDRDGLAGHEDRLPLPAVRDPRRRPRPVPRLSPPDAPRDDLRAGHGDLVPALRAHGKVLDPLRGQPAGHEQRRRAAEQVSARADLVGGAKDASSRWTRERPAQHSITGRCWLSWVAALNNCWSLQRKRCATNSLSLTQR